MRRTEQVQGLRLMKFAEVFGRTHRGGLSQAEAAEVLGVSERTFRRWRDRYEAEGADGLYDRRLGRLSARRAPVDEVTRVLELFDTRYWDFTAKHFHEKLVADHGFKRSYNWLRLSLQAHGRRRAAPRRGAHRRKRPRRALAQLGIELIPAYSPEARGRSERMFGTLQKRLSQELRLAGITDMAGANRFLKELFLPQHNARFATPAEDQGTAFVPFTGALDDILCIHEERTVSNDNTVRYKRLALQIPAGRHRRHYVKARVRVHEYPDGTMAVFHGPRCLARYHADGQLIDSQTREAA